MKKYNKKITREFEKMVLLCKEKRSEVIQAISEAVAGYR